jgi:hypothetical protein
VEVYRVRGGGTACGTGQREVIRSRVVCSGCLSCCLCGGFIAGFVILIFWLSVHRTVTFFYFIPVFSDYTHFSEGSFFHWQVSLGILVLSLYDSPFTLRRSCIEDE